MKKTVLFALFSVLLFQYGCESHHRDDIQAQEEREEEIIERKPQPVSEPERGNTQK